MTISKHIALWKNDKSGRFASVLIHNKGRSVCRIQLTIISYTQDGHILGKLAQEFIFPIIPPNSFLQVDIPITSEGEDIFLYNLLRTIYREHYILHEAKCKLHVMWSFVDSHTGQESIKMQDYTPNDFVYPLYTSKMKLNADFMKSPSSDHYMENTFIDWITGTKHPIPIMSARPINNNVISILPELIPLTDRASITLRLNFSNLNENNMVSPFGMACVSFNPSHNWTFYYENDYYFEFSIGGSEDVHAIQLEIKDFSGTHLIDQEILVTQSVEHHMIRLIKSELSVENFQSIKEVDFTIFPQQMLRPQGHVVIMDCNLITPPTP